MELIQAKKINLEHFIKVSKGLKFECYHNLQSFGSVQY